MAAATAAAARGLARVRNVIAVSSCKGGVGKSMVAVNLAYSLARRLAGGAVNTLHIPDAGRHSAADAAPARVGIFDADLYGPSLPTMVRLPDDDARLRPAPGQEGMIRAPQHRGVKLMSYGYASNQQGGGAGSAPAAVMRGPRASAMVQQLVQNTDWGDLDVLVVDMPPGTGDIPLTLCQSLGLTAAIVVTTPSRLAVVDVVKGMEMFDGLRVPIAALVENMAYFDATFDDDENGDAGGNMPTRTKRFYPFGRGHVNRLVEARGLDVASMVYSLPMEMAVSEAVDAGLPAVLAGDSDSGGGDGDGSGFDDRTIAAPASAFTEPFDKLAGQIVRRFLVPSGVILPAAAGEEAHGETLADLPHAKGPAPSVHYDGGRRSIVLRYLSGPQAGTELLLDPATLRRASRDALSVDEMTGEQLLKPEDVADDIVPLKMAIQGNYGVAIEWSDGHKAGIYSYDQMEELAGR